MKLIINEDTDPVEEKYMIVIHVCCNSFDIRFSSVGHMFTWKR